LNGLPIVWDPGLPGQPAPAPPGSPAGSPYCLWISGLLANRRELAAAAGLAPSAAPADVVAATWARLGETAPEAMAGPCAWVLWDPVRRRLAAVRDRAGARELCWGVAGATLHLDGDPLRLAGALGTESDPHLPSAAAWLHAAIPPAGDTFLRRVGQLAPGGLLIADAEGLTRRRYWKPEPRPPERGGDAEHARRLGELLWQVVAEYAPPGRAAVTVSGGVDSPAVAAALADARPETLPAAILWTVPELPAADESADAREIAHRLGLAAVEVRADLRWPLCEGGPASPEGEPSFTYYGELWDATFAAARRAGAGCLLSGASGDHLFGGNAFAYPDLLLAGRWRELARQLRRHLPRSESGAAAVVRGMILAPLAGDYVPGFPRRRSPPWTTRRCRRLAAEVPPPASVPRGLPPGRRRHLAQLRDPALPRLLAQLGRRAERQGVELRHPLTDHRLVELAAGLPLDQVFRAGERKIVLRNALRGRLPDRVLDRWQKVYPIDVFHRGLREREAARVEPLLDRMRAADLGLVEPAALAAEWQAYRAGATDRTLFWHAVTLEAWLRERLG
jgi:asparagine synthase (glutamine-hydrolysing)